MRVVFSERGATSAILALFLASALGFAALVIDIGNAWQERRNLVTATDAAALEAGQEYALGNNGCGGSNARVVANNPDAISSTCTPVLPTSTSPGRVTVEADAEVDFFFGPILGLDGTSVSSSTTVNWDEAATVDGGLRPFGLCVDYLASIGAEPVGTFVIEYGKDDQPDACGEDAPGNWGTLDFDGGSNSNNDTRDWVENGYDGSVSIGDMIEGDTGNGVTNALRNELNFLMTVDQFTLPVFDSVTGNGANAEFTIVDFAVVRLVDYRAAGGRNSTLTLEFLEGVVQGTGGGPGGFGAFVIGICAVDGVDETTTCT